MLATADADSILKESPMRMSSATLAILGGLGLIAAGCNGSAGLTAIGTATVDVAGTPSGFNFAQPARLDGAAPAGAITGSCTITRTVTEGIATYGVVAELFKPTGVDGNAVRSITLMGRSDSTTGTIEAEIGTGDYRGSCPLTLEYMPNSGEARFVANNCTVVRGAESATVNVDMSFQGCVVVR